VVFDGTLGIEGRAGYYDDAGALVDVIQSHLLQVMSLVAMEPRSTMRCWARRRFRWCCAASAAWARSRQPG
jgi:glucose-6-phosphate 1-dehydrogenase